jgi:hypothetical protein
MEQEQFAEVQTSFAWNWRYEAIHFAELFLAAFLAIQLCKVI